MPDNKTIFVFEKPRITMPTSYINAWTEYGSCFEECRVNGSNNELQPTKGFFGSGVQKNRNYFNNTNVPVICLSIIRVSQPQVLVSDTHVGYPWPNHTRVQKIYRVREYEVF